MLTCSQILNFVAGGHETVGTAFMWSAYALATFPHVQDKLQDEIRGMFEGKPAGWEPEFADIEHLAYLNNFVREILRVYSPGEHSVDSPIAAPSLTQTPPALFLPREAAEDVTICGTFIPKGTIIMVCPNSTHFNPTIWGPDAEHFNPDRWDEHGGSNPAGNHYAFVPFLHGPKGCIARPFAMLALKTTILEMARNFEFSPRPQDVGAELQFANPNFTLRPRDKLNVVVKKRDVYHESKP